ncbi:MAG: hypothetical protein WDO73_04565 [Ignavibacteriota bacterium]
MLDAGVEFVAPPGAERGRDLQEPSVDITAFTTGSLQPRLEITRFSLNGVFQGAGVRNAEHGVGRLQV